MNNHALNNEKQADLLRRAMRPRKLRDLNQLSPKRFDELCTEAAESIGCELERFDDQRQTDTFEDDGSLHVRAIGSRYVFDVSRNQSLSGKQQNERTREVLRVLGVAVPPAALVSENEDEDED